MAFATLGGGLLAVAATLAVNATSFGGCTLNVEGGMSTQCADASGCDDGNECTVDECLPEGICLRTSAPDGPISRQTPDDCRVNQCMGGMLQEGVFDASDVFDDLNPCTQDYCDQQTFETSHFPAAFQSSCEDGAGHTGQCGCVVDNELAECPSGEPIACQISCTGTSTEECNDNEFCTIDSCNSASGFCAREWRAGEPLPEDEQAPNDCRLVQCALEGTGHPSVPDNSDLPLSDDNVCTDDICELGIPYYRGNNAACDDGFFCNGDDFCQPRTDPNEGGDCTFHPGDPCASQVGDGDEDCSESCNEDSNDCTANDGDGTACSDGEYCNGTDTCGGGVCSSHAGNPCPGADGDQDCSESCNEDADDCSANDQNGTSCNDGAYCNGTDTCNNGSCAHAGDPCPASYNDADCAGTCNEGADNCSGPEPNGSPCDDGLYCTSSHACNSNGQCIGSDDPCDPTSSDADCIGACNESARNCTGAEPNGSACDDGQYCNGADTCDASGNCSGHVGSPCSTNYGDADCAGTCSESSDNCTGPEPAGSACNDNLFCNGADTCDSSGGCTGHGSNPCNPDLNDSNCTGACNETADDCTGPEPEDSPCDDGEYCTGTDRCNASGSCSQHTGDPCAGNVGDCDQDCSESCNENTNDCTANDPDNSECDQNSNCSSGTYDGHCSGGSCVND